MKNPKLRIQNHFRVPQHCPFHARINSTIIPFIFFKINSRVHTSGWKIEIPFSLSHSMMHYATFSQVIMFDSNAELLPHNHDIFYAKDEIFLVVARLFPIYFTK